jgi:UDP-N-acetylglucosamine--N-acetylmuramyl-(pentapeptide) pyrophosphoryl-undecaprenol N-acetylglucosamine transferase
MGRKMNPNCVHIVFAGGGTGGHLFPGLAVAQRLAATIPHVRISFCGSGKTFEREHVSRAGFEYIALPSRPMPRGVREAVAFVVANLAGYLAAGRYLRQHRVAAVIGLGGYASVPMSRAAVRRGVPLVLLEQNVVPGRATRWLARRATLICTAFDATSSWPRCRCPVRTTGNPLRRGFQSLDCPPRLTFTAAQSANGPTRQLLVLGGSGGAQSLNENLPRALYKVRRHLENWRIVHQTGPAGHGATESLYRKFGLAATVVPFVEDMPQVLTATDLAICRAGGTTLAELAAAGVPAVLLPYPHAAADHQAANARHFAAAGGCITIDPREVAGRLDGQVAEAVCALVSTAGLRERMSAAMYRLARPRAADDVAELIWSILSSRPHGSAPAVA